MFRVWREAGYPVAVLLVLDDAHTILSGAPAL